MKLDSKSMVIAFLFVVAFITFDSCLNSCKSNLNYKNCKTICNEKGILLVDANTCVCNNQEEE